MSERKPPSGKTADISLDDATMAAAAGMLAHLRSLGASNTTIAGWTIKPDAAEQPSEQAEPAKPPEKPAAPNRKGKGGRPLKWQKLWDVIKEGDAEGWSDQRIANVYNQRQGRAIGDGKVEKATAAKVKEIRHRYGKLAKPDVGK